MRGSHRATLFARTREHKLPLCSSHEQDAGTLARWEWTARGHGRVKRERQKAERDRKLCFVHRLQNTPCGQSRRARRERAEREREGLGQPEVAEEMHWPKVKMLGRREYFFEKREILLEIRADME